MQECRIVIFGWVSPHFLRVSGDACGQRHHPEGPAFLTPLRPAVSEPLCATQCRKALATYVGPDQRLARHGLGLQHIIFHERPLCD